MKILFSVIFSVIFLVGFVFPKILLAQGSGSGTVTTCTTDAQCNALQKCQGGLCISNVTGTSGGGSNSTEVLCEGDKGIQTAIGCIPVLGGQQAFLEFILTWAIGVGGGIAFLLIVYAGFMIMTSQGNPERLKAGQELLTAAISGVILLVLSVFILNLIGVKILQIPGLEGAGSKGGVQKIMP